MIEQIDHGIWTVPSPLNVAGVLALNTRMTVCRLLDGGVALISPVPISRDLTAAIDTLGPVRAIIAPNLLHHLYIGDWIEAYPDALSYGPPGIASKRHDLRLNDTLGSSFDEAYEGSLLRLPIAGMPRVNESLFLHRRSNTLIATDFCFFLPQSSGLTKTFAQVMGITNQVRCEPLFRLLIRDRSAFRTSLQPLRKLEVRHLSMCHHSVLSIGASEALHHVLGQLHVPSSSESGT